MRLFLTRSLSSLFIIGIFSSVGHLHAEPIPPAKPGRIASTLELMQWEARIAENAYATTNSERNLTALLSVYERIVAATCMPQLLKTLQHSGNPSDKICLRYIDETLKLDSENPVATCARDGIDSKSCDQAYAAQLTGTFPKDASLWVNDDSPGSELEQKLEAATEDTTQLSKLETELYRLEGLSQVNQENRALHAPQVRALTHKVIASACQRTKLKIVSLLGDRTEPLDDELAQLLASASIRDQVLALPRSDRPHYLKQLKENAATQRDALERQGEIKGSPMDQVVEALAGDKSSSRTGSARVRPDGLVRWHLISPACDERLKRAESRNLAGALAICVRQGDLAPDCIRARRRERAEVAKASSTPASRNTRTPEPVSGRNFSTF